MQTTFYDFIRTYDKYFFLFVFQNGESYSDSDSRNTYRQHYNIDFPVGSKIFIDSGGYLKSYRVQPDPKMSSYWTIVSLDDIYVKFNSLDSLDVSIYEFGNDGNVVVVYTENDKQTNQVERCMATLTRDCGYKDKKDVVQWLWDFIKREDLEGFDGVKLDDFCVQHDAGPTVLLNTIQWLNDFNWYDRSKVNVYLNMNFGRFNLTLRDLGVNYVTGDKSSYVEEVKNYFGNDAKVEFKPSSNGYWGNVSNPSNFSFDRPGFIDIDYETDIVQNITNSRRNNMFRKNVNVIKSDYCGNYGKRTIKSAVDGGWVVDSSEANRALDMWVEATGEDNALEDIARALSSSDLDENIDYIAQQWDFSEDLEDYDDSWDKYEYAKEVMGTSELLNNLTQAMGYDELAACLAFIFRMNDFRDWKSEYDDEDEDDEPDEDAKDFAVYSILCDIEESKNGGDGDKARHDAQSDQNQLYDYDLQDKLLEEYKNAGGTYSGVDEYGDTEFEDTELATKIFKTAIEHLTEYEERDDEDGDLEFDEWESKYYPKGIKSSRKPIKSAVSHQDDEKQALAQFKGVDVSEIEDGYGDHVYEVDGEEYWVSDYDDAYDEAVLECEEIFDDMGLEAVTEQTQEYFLNNYVRESWFEELAEEEADYFISEMDDEDLLEYAHDHDCAESIDDVDDENFDRTDIEDQCKSEYENEILNMGMSGYLESIYGRNWVKEMKDTLKNELDWHGMAEYCVDTDGIAHTIASYDGDENEETINGTDYYIYRRN